MQQTGRARAKEWSFDAPPAIELLECSSAIRNLGLFSSWLIDCVLFGVGCCCSINNPELGHGRPLTPEWLSGWKVGGRLVGHMAGSSTRSARAPFPLRRVRHRPKTAQP